MQLRPLRGVRRAVFKPEGLSKPWLNVKDYFLRVALRVPPQRGPRTAREITN